MQHPAFEAARSAEEWGRQPLGCTVFFSRRQQFMGCRGAAGESLEKDGRPSLGRYEYAC